jgi:hypothetical protein
MISNGVVNTLFDLPGFLLVCEVIEVSNLLLKGSCVVRVSDVDYG